ncbi:Phosphinothricin N-acetyltransferase, putative [Moritella viscosa]|uniref:Phosphinothricin N-acetyltransferase, putative n=1 Tax=Moritella viscosa TaxID=80854 RepID=A0A090I9G1_9GAMM|nr:arsinothricin resistance N-acetyltransferase ArsN1 family B [Moritella viscosa]CED58555.1 putative acetyltransferase, GNAT family [Moritella viscosa]SGY83047.1 Phosphinothricin N-acetyltransferase, putative [Moritella viscosa]SHN96799.1 Phosphinothricin N-acetyltransferase, putative [Moritella viscosa]SHN96800.1 Phosphinothricin N-acetyltransferase, putative [Moritella viscosa]SHN96846.1 Phosphinothricin N-acetyltransferase, putative [Moritella viscosa]
MIRIATKQDAEAISHIYNHYITTTVITFEEEVVSSDDIADRIKTTLAAGLPWLIAEEDNIVLGYAYATPWKSRSAYQFSVETSVYLDPNASRKGWGSQLYQALFVQLQHTKVRTVIGGIALPNPASIALHEKLGMHKSAHFSKIGYKFNQWIDVGYWQKSLT